jgi:hypothetical protein
MRPSDGQLGSPGLRQPAPTGNCGRRRPAPLQAYGADVTVACPTSGAPIVITMGGPPGNS